MTDRRSGAHPAARRRPVRRIAASFALAATVLAGPAIGTAAAAPVTEVDLAKYARTAQHDLPEPTRTSGEAAGDLLAKEASAVTYDWDRDTLFVVGDEGTSIVQVSKTGQLIDVMQLSGFADTEGLAYIGNGQFIVSEERERAVHRFTYAKDTTLTRRRPDRRSRDAGRQRRHRGHHERPGHGRRHRGRQGEGPAGHLPHGPGLHGGHRHERLRDDGEPDEPLRPRTRRHVGPLRRLRAAQRPHADRRRRGQPAGRQPGGRADRRGRPLRLDPEHADHPRRREQRPVGPRPDPRGRGDGRRRHDLHGQRGRRRRHRPPAALGLPAHRHAERGADRGLDPAADRVAARELDDHRPAEGRRRQRHGPRRPGHERVQRHGSRRRVLRGRPRRPLPQGRHRAGLRDEAELHRERAGRRPDGRRPPTPRARPTR